DPQSKPVRSCQIETEHPVVYHVSSDHHLLHRLSISPHVWFADRFQTLQLYRWHLGQPMGRIRSFQHVVHESEHGEYFTEYTIAQRAANCDRLSVSDINRINDSRSKVKMV